MVKRKLAALIFLAGVTVAAYSITLAPRWLRLSRLTLQVPGLPAEWTGLRISHLSDFHLGAKGLDTAHIHKARKLAIDFKPDIIALTGDYYDVSHRVPSEGLFTNWPDDVTVLGVMGNHDRRVPGSFQETMDELRDAGVILLNNDATRLTLRGKTAWIAGVDDAHTYNADVNKALAGVPDGETVLLMLSHAPAPIVDLRPGDARVMLAGHTHGGQVRINRSGAIPFVKWIRKLRGAKPRPDGPVYRRWHWINGTILVISDGLGVSTLPIRFRTRPHLILIDIEPAGPAGEEACDDVGRYVVEHDREPWLLRALT